MNLLGGELGPPSEPGIQAGARAGERPGSVRAFVAVRLDDQSRAVLRDEIDRLRRVAPGVAWVAGEDLHVTLKFLGQVETARLRDVAAGLEDAMRAARPFDLEIRGLGAFPSASRPRVVWAGIAAGLDPMTALAEQVEQALAPLGFPREARPFSPHVTLGRIREPRRDPRLSRAIEAGGAREFGVTRVAAVWLMRSDLSGRGARYAELAAASISGP